jgi:adenosylmethionine-8-amino-7-oxononanoate aminotransferase
MMATVPDDHATLQEKARRHLWLHFSRLGAFADHDIPVFVRGEGVHLFDDTGKRYLDGLSGLFVVQIGHGRHELAEAAASQAERLAYYPIWQPGSRPSRRPT